MNQKSKGTAYLLWFFLGFLGAHKFYLERIGMGILYILTLGIFGIGWFIDLFTLGHQVDVYNAMHRQGVAANVNQQQSVMVNVAAPTTVSEPKTSAEKQILTLASAKPVLTVKDVVAKTTLDIEEAETALKKLVTKGMAREVVSPEGKPSYDFS